MMMLQRDDDERQREREEERENETTIYPARRNEITILLRDQRGKRVLQGERDGNERVKRDIGKMRERS